MSQNRNLFSTISKVPEFKVPESPVLKRPLTRGKTSPAKIRRAEKEVQIKESKQEENVNSSHTGSPAPSNQAEQMQEIPSSIDPGQLTEGRIIPKKNVEILQDFFRFEHAGITGISSQEITGREQPAYFFSTSEKKIFVIHDTIEHSKPILGAPEEKETLLTRQLAQDIESGEWFFCMKYEIQGKQQANSPIFLNIQAEINLLKQAEFYIAEYTYTGEKKLETYVIKKYVPGQDLIKVLKENPDISFEEKLVIANGLVAEIARFHEVYKMSCCDIKLENFIYHPKTKKLSFTDVDGALILNENGVGQTNLARGTFGHLAPETCAQDPITGFYHYDARSDIYALGQVLIDLFQLDEYLPSAAALPSSIKRYAALFDFSNNKERIIQQTKKSESTRIPNGKLVLTIKV